MHSRHVSLDDLGVFALMAKALAVQPVGQEAFDRRAPTPDATAKPDTPPRRGLLERIEHWFWKREQRALEAHLSEAKDIYDLEARIRDLERGVLYRYY